MDVVKICKLLEEEKPGMISFLRRVGHSYEAVQDIYQQTCLNEIMYAHAIDENHNPKGHAWRAIKNTRIKYLKKESRHMVAEDPEVFGQVMDYNLTEPLEDMIDTEGIDQIWQAIDGLKPRKHEVIMHVYNGGDLHSLAQLRDRKPNTTKVEIVRARNALREKLSYFREDYQRTA